MFTLKALAVSLNVPSEAEDHNEDLVGYVISKYPRKVVKVSVITRDVVDSWYTNVVKTYPQTKFTFLIATVSVVGEITGLTEIEKSASQYGVKHDPAAN